MASVYHEGERSVQERAGVRAMADRIGRGVGDSLTPAIAQFLAGRYTLYVGSIDARGRPWASQLVGPPGFVRALDDRTVRVEVAPDAGDPLAEALRTNPAVGLLAIDFTTRRRVRVNGRARLIEAGAIELRVEQAYGNCPKYIQRREPVDMAGDDASGVTETTAVISAEVRAVVSAADVFFLATTHPTAGADVSHRGGRPGFVHLVDDRTLVWPDYAGNTMFQSLGNLAVDPRAGVLFVDFAGRATVQATGRASIDWDPARAAAFPGAERLVELEIDEVRWSPAGNPIRWRLVEPSPHNP
jgi:uncharacterized protein